MPPNPSRASGSVDLRSRTHAFERLPRRWQRLYTGSLLLVAAVGLADIAIGGYTFRVPREVEFALERRDGAVVVRRAPVGSDLAAGDVVRAISVAGREPADIRDLPAVLRAAGTAPVLTLEIASGDTAAAESRSVDVGLTTADWTDVLDTLLTSLWAIFIAVLGLLVLRARETTPAVRRLLDLCLLAALPVAILTLWSRVAQLWVPWTGATDGGAAGGGVANPLFVAVLAAWPFLFGTGLLRFLHVFPTPSEEARRRFGFPRGGRWMRGFVWCIAGFAALLTVAVLAGVGDQLLERRLILMGGAAVLALTFALTLFVPLIWLIRVATAVFRLTRWRLETADSDELGASRAVLAGIRGGALLFGLLLVAFIPLSIAANGGTMETVSMLGLIILGTGAITVPFIGMAIGVSRRGLWDVDLVVRKASIYSLLGTGFVAMLAVTELVLDEVMPDGVFGLAPVVAGAVVAAARKPVSRRITRRFFPGVVELASALEDVSVRLAADSPEPPGIRLGTAFRDGLELEHCAVVPADAGPPLFSHPTDWDAMRFAAAAAARPDKRSLVLETDEGPLLAVRVGPSQRAPIVLLGTRPGGQFYSSEDRRLIEMLLNPLAPLFSAGAPART